VEPWVWVLVAGFGTLLGFEESHSSPNVGSGPVLWVGSDCSGSILWVGLPPLSAGCACVWLVGVGGLGC